MLGWGEFIFEYWVDLFSDLGFGANLFLEFGVGAHLVSFGGSQMDLNVLTWVQMCECCVFSD